MRQIEAGGKIQYVIFKVGTAFYGLPVSVVKEILRYKEPVPVPEVPEYITGVVEVRSEILPVIELSTLRIHESNKESNKRKIMRMSISEKEFGFVVDNVIGVEEVSVDSLRDVPPLLQEQGLSIATKLAKIHDKIVILLDPEKILSPAEWEALDKFSKSHFSLEGGSEPDETH